MSYRSSSSMPSSSMLDSVSSWALPGVVRCNVRLPNGCSIRVPIIHDASVADLLQAAITRGAAMMPTSDRTLANSAIMLGGEQAAYLYEGDAVCNVVQDPEKATFVLVAKETSIDASDTLCSFDADTCGVRWVAAQTAVTAPTIASIPVKTHPLSLSTNIAALRLLALEELHSSDSTTQELFDDVTPLLFTKACQILSPETKSTNLGDLRMMDSTVGPLSIFMVPVRPSQSTIKEALGFKSSDRGIATFTTCLKLFILKVGKDPVRVQNFMNVLWELTHFPPAIVALKEVVIRSELDPLPCAILATCFRALCLQVVPQTFYAAPVNILECSRQVFSWLCSLNSHSTLQPNPSETIVHKVEIRKKGSPSDILGGGDDESEEIAIIPGDAEEVHKLVVYKARQDAVSAELLATALDNGSDEVQFHYYFDLPLNSGNAELHQKRTPIDPSFFGILLRTTNEDELFKMIGPFQLSQCPGSVLPVITLDSDALVSLYDNGHADCSMFTSTTNVINGQRKLAATEPGQFLLQKLEPFAEQRKRTGQWEIDAWQEEPAHTFGGSAHEAIMVCADLSSSMDTAMGPNWFEYNDIGSQPEMTRLNEVKEFFANFVIRLNAYRVSADLGLVTFASNGDVKIRQALTSVILKFKDVLNNIAAYGRTALWDGIQTGCDLLVKYKAKHPDTKLRLILLTDGGNNDSTRMPSDVCAELCKHNIVLDAIVIGTNETEDLFKMAKHTGGYAFHPQSRMALFQTFLLENFIDIKTRPDIFRVPLTDYETSRPKVADLRDIFDFPPCRPHNNQDDHFIALADAHQYLQRSQPKLSQASSQMSSNSSRLSASRVLLDQVQLALHQPHTYMDIYVSESNMAFWKVVMRGRADTQYARGIFLTYVEIGEDFPLKPPTMRFITPIMHSNVSKHGRICHPIFDKGWDSSFSIMQVLQYIWGMLVLTESTDAVDPISMVRFYTDPDSAQKLIDKYITRFARKSRREHRLDICGPDPIILAGTPGVRSSRPSGFTVPDNGSLPRLTRQSLASVPVTLTSLPFRHGREASQQPKDPGAVHLADTEMVDSSTIAPSDGPDDLGSFCNIPTPSNSQAGSQQGTRKRRFSFFDQFQ